MKWHHHHCLVTSSSPYYNWTAVTMIAMMSPHNNDDVNISWRVDSDCGGDIIIVAAVWWHHHCCPVMVMEIIMSLDRTDEYDVTEQWRWCHPCLAIMTSSRRRFKCLPGSWWEGTRWCDSGTASQRCCSWLDSISPADTQKMKALVSTPCGQSLSPSLEQWKLILCLELWLRHWDHLSPSNYLMCDGAQSVSASWSPQTPSSQQGEWRCRCDLWRSCLPYLLPGVDAVADPRASGLGAALTQWPIIHLGSRQTQETQTEKKEKNQTLVLHAAGQTVPAIKEPHHRSLMEQSGTWSTKEKRHIFTGLEDLISRSDSQLGKSCRR